MILKIKFDEINERFVIDDDPSVTIKINPNPSITIKI